MAENIIVNGEQYDNVEGVALPNEDGEDVVFYPDAVRHVTQELTEEQKTQARTNIGAASKDEVGNLAKEIVTHTAQTLTDEQKAQARANIGAATVEDVLSALPIGEGVKY